MLPLGTFQADILRMSPHLDRERRSIDQGQTQMISDPNVLLHSLVIIAEVTSTLIVLNLTLA